MQAKAAPAAAPYAHVSAALRLHDNAVRRLGKPVAAAAWKGTFFVAGPVGKPALTHIKIP
ncbi:hypothetical protein [Paenibacillus tyrfis]|uniref:hypothetical protein n=1 Tax=Paenibacillus tyrfis TaxID=1501230 RepID=UPI00209D9D7D|nr:hypothetical protein [Paenibacillus tyrfis]MCP1307732.1 hypothetical protein [Paenibacillus tyrfis]